MLYHRGIRPNPTGSTIPLKGEESTIAGVGVDLYESLSKSDLYLTTSDLNSYGGPP